MTTEDPRIRREQIHGQEVLLPALDAWQEIARDGLLDVLPSPLPDWMVRWLDAWLNTYSGFAAASLGLVRLPVGWVLVSLLRLGDRYFRVHFEDVICEHCGRRCGPSATPDSVAYAGSGYSTQEAWADFDELPVQRCPHCTGVLRRR